MNILYVLLAILMLSVVITIHELGHFLVGRACGIGVVEFSVGMGPLLLSRKKNGTQYSLRALPIGGYCKFVGEDEDDNAPNAMNAAPVWKRFLTVLAGPVMNFVLAYVIVVALFCFYPQTIGAQPVIDEVIESMPAGASGLQVGDVITAVNGEAVSMDQSGVDALREVVRQGGEVRLSVDRGGQALTFELTPTQADDGTGSTVYQIGVTFAPIKARDNLFEALRDGAVHLCSFSTLMLDTLRNLIFRFRGAEDLAGPIGTVAVVSQQLSTDWTLIFDFAFIISLNLGIINLIPFPGLDGSRLLFLIAEAIRRKPVPPEKEGLVHALGLVVLLILAGVLAVHDIMTYVL